MATTVDASERAKQERRRQIMSAAKGVFAEAGYHGASINSIIERAQIARISASTLLPPFRSASHMAAAFSARGPSPIASSMRIS